MTLARKQLVCLEATPYYHCISRCVRRAFLCGLDPYLNKSYEHRREWVESLILHLSNAFCIDIAAYAVMSNHYHVVVHINQQRLNTLSDYEVIDRWGMLYSLPPLIRQYRDGDRLESAQLTLVSGYLERYRFNLTNISKFMGYLNERIARQANAEDQCTGRFWEGRFKSQALLDETALLQCMAYVDLNPIRAGIADTPESSEHTSVKRRIEGIHTSNLKSILDGLLPFTDQKPSINQSINKPAAPIEDSENDAIPFQLLDYIDMVDWTGRQLRVDKKGVISNNTPPILERLGLGPEQWLDGLSTTQKPWMPKALGTKEAIQKYCQMIGKQWLWGVAKMKPT